uniref:Uncharacterized protein n=1 Tax=Ditylenchus dipsaci TaxID=166011 RepID=A0A915EP65_9BILA
MVNPNDNMQIICPSLSDDIPVNGPHPELHGCPPYPGWATPAAAAPRRILRITNPDETPVLTALELGGPSSSTWQPTKTPSETRQLNGEITLPCLPNEKKLNKLHPFELSQKKEFGLEVYQLFQAMAFVTDQGGTLTNAINLLMGYGLEPLEVSSGAVEKIEKWLGG